MQNLSQEIKELLRIAKNVPFYAQKLDLVGISNDFLDSCNDVDLFSAFYRIPPTRKEEIRKTPHQLLAKTQDIVYRGATSGTTGEAFMFFRESVWNEKRLATLHKFLAWWGINEQIAIANINSRLFPLRYQDYSIIGGIDNYFLQWLNFITKKPMALRGYPSRLCEVALIAQDKINFDQVKTIICTGEPLFDHQKQLLADIFDCPIITEYGSQECGVYGFSCPVCGNLHIDEGRCLIEEKDKRLLVTDLYSHNMPMIRYYNGDLVEIEKNDSCPHGTINLTILGRDGDNFDSSKFMYPIKGVDYYRSIPTKDNKTLVGYLNKTNSAEVDGFFSQEISTIFTDNIPLFIQKFISATDIYKATNPPMQDEYLADFIPIEIVDYHQFFLNVIKGDRWIYYNIPDIILEQSYRLLDNCNYPLSEQIKLDKMYLLVINFAHKIDAINDNLVKLFHKYHDTDNLSLIYIDLLAIALFTDNKNLLKLLSEKSFNFKLNLDSFDYQLILKLVSLGIKKIREKKKVSLISKLNPLLPLFISDLDFCQRYSVNCLPSILAHWANILGCYSGDEYKNNLPSELENRENVLFRKKPNNLSLNNLPNLSILELKEVLIQIVIFDLDINTNLLLDTIKATQNTKGKKEMTKIIAFIPFMNYLAKLLSKQGQREKAYQCLLISENISFINKNFDSVSRLYNFKQKIF